MGKQILLIQSDRGLAEETAVFLRGYSFKIDMAFNGADALERTQHVPDLVLVDCALSDMRGTEFCQRLKKNRQFHGTPVIFFSNHHLEDQELEDIYACGDDHITKPFDQKELLARIEVVLKCRQSSIPQNGKEEVVLNELKRILKEGLVIPFFQPIYSMKSLLPVGLEALTRPSTETFLNNPELMFRAALTFGLYQDIESMAWRKAFSFWKKEINEGKIFLNCTPYFIGSNPADEGFFKTLGIDPGRVVLEITERTAIPDHADFTGKLDSLSALGVQIAVDDVGSGYASLDTVARIRPDYVKIDLSLIRDIHCDSLKENMVQAIIDFCHKSGIVTVAEGVEKHEELQMVRGLGVDAVQGYLLARPAPEVDKNIFSKKISILSK